MTNRLRPYLEAWERETADQWDAALRSPRNLRRLGAQIQRSAHTQQRIRAALRGTPTSPDDVAQTARLLYLLERLDAQIAALEVRVARLESAAPHD